jgi:hypothetical protein
MNKEVKEFEETTISAKSGIKIIKLVFLEDDFPVAGEVWLDRPHNS